MKLKIFNHEDAMAQRHKDLKNFRVFESLCLRVNLHGGRA